MKTIHHTALQALAQRVFKAAGVTQDDAAVVAEMLVEADLMGLPSHGVQRIPQYLEDMDLGAIVPGAAVLVERRSSTTALIDGQWNFGQLVARHAAEQAIAMAAHHGTGCVVVRGCRHIGRVGRYTEMCAAAGCVGLAMTAGGKEGHWVAPFGGREGRLGTNPIAFAAPTGGDRISMDFSTPIAPEGKVRLLRDTGSKFAEPSLVDRHGRLSCDPSVLYADDGSRAGAILPFGGDQGYKSFGLGFMRAKFFMIRSQERSSSVTSSGNTERNVWGLTTSFRTTVLKRRSSLLRRRLLVTPECPQRTLREREFE